MVSAFVRAMVKAKPKRLPLKRIQHLQAYFFPFSTILCPPTPQADAGPSQPSFAPAYRATQLRARIIQVTRIPEALSSDCARRPPR